MNLNDCYNFNDFRKLAKKKLNLSNLVNIKELDLQI